MNVALYSRVSTHDQSTAAQLKELNEISGQRGWTIAGTFEDVISGSTKNRPALDALLARLAQGGIDAVVVVKIDRLGRSLANFVELVAKFRSFGTAIICTSQGIDTTKSNPCGELLQNLLASFAQFERSLIQERTRAGLAVARAAGKKIGRPSALLIPEPERTAVILAWRAEGKRGYRELGVRLGGVSGATAMRADRKAAPAAAAAAPEDWTD